MKKQTQLMLVRRLAALESAYKPVRRHEWCKACAIFAARREGSVRAWGEGGDGRHRKAVQRYRDEATAAGLMRGNALTPEGRRRIRGWCWPFSVADLERGVLRLADALSRGDYMQQNGRDLVPEQLLCGEWWGEQTAMLQWLFGPLLTDGVLVSHSLTNGRVFYAFMGQPDIAVIAEATVAGSPEAFDGELADAYDAAFGECRQRILADDRKHNELGDLPLVLMRLESGRDHHDLADIGPLFDEAEAGCG